VLQTIVNISTVTEGTTYRLTTNTMQEDQVGEHNFKLIVTLENLGKNAYPKLEVPFTVTITPAVCDCTMLSWDAPAPQSLSTTVLVEPSATLTIVHANANAASKTLHPAIRKCYQ